MSEPGFGPKRFWLLRICSFLYEEGLMVSFVKPYWSYNSLINGSAPLLNEMSGVDE